MAKDAFQTLQAISGSLISALTDEGGETSNALSRNLLAQLIAL